MLPIVRLGELGIVLAILEIALETQTLFAGKVATPVYVRGVGAGLIKLTKRVIFSIEMPVHVDRAQSNLVVGNSAGLHGSVTVSPVALGQFGTGLLTDHEDFIHDGVVKLLFPTTK
jgi:hypothetical protein